MAAVGSAVGLGNLWRFPYICAKYGGGAFLLPYFIVLVLVGIPLLILEFGLGHRMQRSAPLAIQNIRPTFNWVGWWSVVAGFVIIAYYTVIMAWCLQYLIYSLTPGMMGKWFDGAKSFFFDEHLRMNTDILPSPGGMNWPVVVGLVVCWFAIFMLIHKGIKRVSKVVLITVPLPIILVVILFIRGITLEGAATGLKYYLRPDFELLKDPQVWLAAVAQIFFSLSLGFGVMVAYASYLNKKSDIANNAYITGMINCGFSFFAGFAVFSVLGFLAVTTGMKMEQGGPGLAFVAYPTALARLPLPNVFSVMFFVTLLTLGIDSAFSIVEAITAAVMEKFDISRHKALLLVCSVGFLAGLVYCTQNGLTLLDTTDHFNEFAMAACGLALCIVVGWFYGARKMRIYINSVSDIRIGRWWDVLIKYFIPLVIGALLVVNIRTAVKDGYEGYPRIIVVLAGWVPLLSTVVVGTILMVVKSKYRPATTKSMVKVLIWLAIAVAGVGFYPAYPEIVIAGFGCIFLYGGLWYCIHRARRARREAMARQRAAIEDSDAV